MSKHLPLILAHALAGEGLADLRPRDPFVCFADDETGAGYATEGELGYYDENGRWVPADYSTVGQLLRLPSRPQAGPMRIPPQGRPAPQRPGPAPQRPAYGPAGISQAQVESIVRSMSLTEAQVRRIVSEIVSAQAPYGAIPSRVSPDEALFPMGLGFVILTGGPPAFIGPALFTNGGQGILPQRAFRGERLVLSTFRSGGAATVPVIVDTFKVGDYSQLVGGAPVPVETFAPDAFGVRLMLDGAVPGVTYTLSVSVPAAVGIPAGETITVVGAVLGRTGEAAQR